MTPRLQELLAKSFQSEIGALPTEMQWRPRVVRATVINGPGAEGTEWRAHVMIDPNSGTFRSVEITDDHGGEGHCRQCVEEGEVVLGDRAYAAARGIGLGQPQTSDYFATGPTSGCLI